MTRELDRFLSGRYQACAMNFNDYSKQLFGARAGLDDHLAYSIQFLELKEAQLATSSQPVTVPQRSVT